MYHYPIWLTNINRLWFSFSVWQQNLGSYTTPLLFSPLIVIYTISPSSSRLNFFTYYTFVVNIMVTSPFEHQHLFFLPLYSWSHLYNLIISTCYLVKQFIPPIYLGFSGGLIYLAQQVFLYHVYIPPSSTIKTSASLHIWQLIQIYWC